MSSVLSAFPSVLTLPTKFSALITPSYEETLLTGAPDNADIPIPFTVVNQVLDINVTQSADIQSFVTNGTYPVRTADVQGKALGGMKIITSLGPNMITYLRNLINTHEDDLSAAYTGPLVLYVQPIMTKVQIVSLGLALDDGEFATNGPFLRDRSWGFTTEAPVSEYTGGGPTNNFFTAFIFKTPMTIQYVAPTGGFKYITFTSQFAEE
jgi:hypothetical protein